MIRDGEGGAGVGDADYEVGSSGDVAAVAAGRLRLLSGNMREGVRGWFLLLLLFVAFVLFHQRHRFSLMLAGEWNKDGMEVKCY